MSRALDNLNRVVTNTIKTESGVVITKDKLIDLVDTNLGDLYNVSQFFTAIESDQSKLQQWLVANIKDTNKKSIRVYTNMLAGLTATARATMNSRFLGSMCDTINSMIVVLEEVSGNIDKLFVEKNMTIYSTKISHVAILGMLENGAMFAEFCNKFIEAFMYDRDNNLDQPERYVYSFLDEKLPLAVELMNRVLNAHLSKTFMAAILKYRNGGSDSNVAGGDKSTVQLARVNTEVTEQDIDAGARGFKIFRIIGTWFTDFADRKARKKVALREQLQARARLLQLQLNGEEEGSPEYQRLTRIISNYQKQIDRLNQQLAKYES